jgi:hypothetical protein
LGAGAFMGRAKSAEVKQRLKKKKSGIKQHLLPIFSVSVLNFMPAKPR